MAFPFKTRLHTLRRGWGLTQQDLAALLPSCGRNRIRRLERGVVEPSAGELIAYMLIFGVSAHFLFPHLYEEVTQIVLNATEVLREKYEHKTTPKAKRKLQLLDEVTQRSTSNSNRHEA